MNAATSPGSTGSLTARRDPLGFLSDEVAELKEKHLYRPLRVMSSAQGPEIDLDGRHVINLSSNDYLGLTHHPRMREAALRAVREFGAGSGAVRSIIGTMSLHEQLEAELAVFKHTEAVLTFQSGFTANTGVIPVVTGEQDLILSDSLNHASIIDGMRLSKAPRKVYPHKDIAALRELLRDAHATGRQDGSGQPYRLILIVTDGVFSMDGDIAPLPEIVAAAEEYDDVAVFVDDAHSSGVLGQNGRGTVNHFGLDGRVAIQVGTLSKAVGVLGGYVAGSQALRDILIQRARPVPLLHVASAGRRRRLHRGDPDLPGGARADRPPLVEHEAVQGRAHAPRPRYGPFGDADHAGHAGRLRPDPAVQPAPLRRGRVRHDGALPDRRPRQGPDPHDRLGGPLRRATRPGARRIRPGGARTRGRGRLARSRRSGTERERGDGLELIVLGAGPAYTDRLGAIGASYLLRDGDDSLLLDMGQGSFPSLANAIEPSRLTGVVISHLHPDHFIDLVALRHYLRYQFEPPRRVPTYGPADLAHRLDALHAEPGFAEATFDHVPFGGPGVRQIGPFTVEATLVTHTAESYGYRVTGRGGASMVYSGDCGQADDLAPLIRPGDVLLTEVSFGPGPVPPGAFHLDAPAVGRLASSRQAGRVFLTHLQMGFDRDETVADVRALFAGPVDLVQPGDRFSL